MSLLVDLKFSAFGFYCSLWVHLGGEQTRQVSPTGMFYVSFHVLLVCYIDIDFVLSNINIGPLIT